MTSLQRFPDSHNSCSSLPAAGSRPVLSGQYSDWDIRGLREGSLDRTALAHAYHKTSGSRKNFRRKRDMNKRKALHSEALHYRGSSRPGVSSRPEGYPRSHKAGKAFSVLFSRLSGSLNLPRRDSPKYQTPTNLETRRARYIVRRISMSVLTGLLVWGIFQCILAFHAHDTVIIAKHDIAQGTILRPSDITASQIPANPLTSKTAHTRSEVAGRISKIPLKAGYPVLLASITDAPLYPKEYTVISITPASAVQPLSPGQKADLVSTGPCSPQDHQKTDAADTPDSRDKAGSDNNRGGAGEENGNTDTGTDGSVNSNIPASYDNSGGDTKTAGTCLIAKDAIVVKTQQGRNRGFALTAQDDTKAAVFFAMPVKNALAIMRSETPPPIVITNIRN